MDNPYRNLSPEAFWKLAVSDKNPFDISGLYSKKFPITKKDRLVSAGSCFAQHIAKRLSANGYNYCDYEPAPADVPEADYSAFNYGVYSARYCNIYTVRQLRQTMERAFDLRPGDGAIWTDGDRFVDSYRPVLEPTGFKSAEDLLASRESHYEAVRRVFEECDIFIFTFGLTEAWQDTETGDIYPLCPGTKGGTFDANRHEFVNFTHAEMMEDLEFLIATMQLSNPAVRFLFTVSPVPLTATASGQHVLAATTYSKSALRAVAGDLEARHDFVDYFPSFEIVSSVPFRGLCYEPDLRSVNPAGVDLVMSHFFREHDGTAIGAATDNPPNAATDDEIVCEELLLEAEATR